MFSIINEIFILRLLVSLDWEEQGYLKITNVKVFSPENRVIVKIETDEGISGIGDAGGGRRANSMSAAISDLAHYLIGKDPCLIEHHYQVMCRSWAWSPKGGFNMTAISGVEQALWDILGKSLNTPIYQLLGGRCRNKIRVYTHTSRPEHALEIVKKGITAIKVDPIPGGGSGRMYVWKRFSPEMMKQAVDTFAKVREAVGSKITLMAHLHQELSPATAVVLANKLEPYDPFWFEEPIEPGNVKSLAWIAAHTSIPIASGENLHTRHEFRKVLETNAVDFVQPDPIYAGGIWECRKIAAMAEPYYVSYASHFASLTSIALAANVQIDACTPNCAIQEVGWRAYEQYQYMVEDPLLVENGYLKVPTKPGLGVGELNEEVVINRPTKIEEPILDFAAYDDGTIFGGPDSWSSEDFMLHPDKYRKL